MVDLQSRLTPARTRRLAVALFLVCTTFLLSHSINAFVEHELAFIPSSEIDLAVSPDTVSPPAWTPDQLAEQIKTSGLFQLPAQPSPVTPDGTPAKPPKPPLNLAQQLRLLGTVHDAQGGGFAVIEDIASKRQHLVRLHETIENVGELAEIRRDEIVIRRDDQEGIVGLALLQGSSPASPPSAPTPASPAIAQPAKRTLDRREVEQAVSDPSKLLMQAHAVPYLQNGVLQGFRLDFVNPGGFFDKAGFQYGDVIQRINGVEIRDPGRLLGMFNQVVNERTVKVDILRAAQKTTLTYELR
jgi:general secretion pathway protein C